MVNLDAINTLCSKVRLRWSLLFLLCFLFALGPVITSCGGSGNADSAAIVVTFHDTRINGEDVVSVDMTVVETQIIDMNDEKTVISSTAKSFNLLEATKNNPVVLAHTNIAAGTYKQIRLILDPESTITLADGSTHPIKVPSGEFSGFKIDGIFEIPDGKLYTLDIDLDPNESIIYTYGEGYILKPVISITGSEENVGNFFYAGEYGGESFVVMLNLNGTFWAITSSYSKYITIGAYAHNGKERTLTLVPWTVVCPSCSKKDKLEMKLFGGGDTPPPMTFNVISFGADFIEMSAAGSFYRLDRVPTFSLYHKPPSKDFTLHVTGIESQYAGKTVFGVVHPYQSEGKAFVDIDSITDANDAFFDFSIPLSSFGDQVVKEYVLYMGIVNTVGDLRLNLQTGILKYENGALLNSNCGDLLLMDIHKNTDKHAPIDVAFGNSCDY